MQYPFSYDDVMAEHYRRLQEADTYRKHFSSRRPGRLTVALLSFVARIARGLAIRLEHTVESLGSREHSGHRNAAA